MENQAQSNSLMGNQSSSSKPALELPHRAMSLPPVQIEELQASPPLSPKAKRPLETAVSAASGLKVLHDTPEEVRTTPRASNGMNITEEGSSNSSVIGMEAQEYANKDAFLLWFDAIPNWLLCY